MTSTGLLRLGTVEVRSSATGNVIGYAFAEASGRGQMQRWLLHEDPQNALEIRSPPEHMAQWGRSDWQSNVAKLWKPGSFYVWAQADVFEHGGTYDGETWTTIPPADALPQPSYPTVPGHGFQLHPPEGKVLEIVQDSVLGTPERHRGVVFTVGSVRQASNVEYWALPEGYEPAGATRGARVGVGVEGARTLQEFIDVANGSWAPGSRFVITGCINYRGEKAPTSP